MKGTGRATSVVKACTTCIIYLGVKEMVVSIIFKVWPLPGLRESVTVSSYCRRNFKMLTLVANCPSSDNFGIALARAPVV